MKVKVKPINSALEFPYNIDTNFSTKSDPFLQIWTNTG